MISEKKLLRRLFVLFCVMAFGYFIWNWRVIRDHPWGLVIRLAVWLIIALYVRFVGFGQSKGTTTLNIGGAATRKLQ
jgi:hypothetical protein